MPRKTTSPWDFGELFPPQDTRRVLTVTELTRQVKGLLEAQLGSPWVSGEVSNLRVQASGHCYFTLKDANAQLACVLFRSAARSRRDLLEDGRQLLLQGNLTVYEPRGQYQLVVQQIELQGVGALQLAFERLKQKLQTQGWFAPERKRPLPPFPERLGIVTSPTAAALRDVLHVLARRQPSLEVVLAPCRVQGDGAADEIVAALQRLNEYHRRQLTAAPAPPPAPALSPTAPPASGRRGLDLILLTRGGGSLEDLWAFNEEAVARALFESALPVISAVGHEIDFTISDFVADLRAATPSAAAEIITQPAVAARQYLVETRQRLPDLARDQWEHHRQSAQRLADRLARAHPRRRVNEAWQRLDDLGNALTRTARFQLRHARSRWENLRAAWHHRSLRQRLEQHRLEQRRLTARLLELAHLRLAAHQQKVRALLDRLRLLSPEQTLARGYSITTDPETGRVIRSVQQASAGRRLRTLVRDGHFDSRIESP